jgi:peptidoglycan-associated lipoprotein
MKLTNFATVLMLGLVLSFAATGCRKKPQSVTNIPNPARTGPGDLGPTDPLQPTPEPGDSSGGIPLAGPDAHKGWPENAEVFKAFTVYFAYDSSAIRADEKSKVGSVADYLKANAQEAVRVEGNCDERGTEEYNRSLGERRALAVREELIRLGIDSGRVDTKSWGEDNAANAPGHDEAAWRQNRRSDFILLSPPK